MASLYRKPVVVTDPATGDKVKAKSKKWSGQYRDADGRLRRCPLAIDKMAGCKWKLIAHVTADSALHFLGELRRQGRSAQTYNHYLKSAKSSTRWLVRDKRSPADPLAYLSKLNVRTDRRHDRRALSPEELSRLLDAARAGKLIEGIRGKDRAMMYALAAWTGFRKGEIGSLTKQSLNLDGDPPIRQFLGPIFPTLPYDHRRRQGNNSATQHGQPSVCET